MDVTANQNVMVGCDEAEVNDGHYTGIGKSERGLPTTHRTFSPYFWVNGGTIPFKRRYSTSCP
jgi:hypothetical protein